MNSKCTNPCPHCEYEHGPDDDLTGWCHVCGFNLTISEPLTTDALDRSSPEAWAIYEDTISRLEAEKAELVEALQNVVDACNFCSGTGFLRDHPDIPCRVCGHVLKLLAKYEKENKE